MAMGLAFLWHFGMIVIFKEVIIREPNAYVRNTEIALIFALVCFGFYLFIDALKRGKG